MRKTGASLLERCAASLAAAMRDDGERCHRCGVCHNVCGLMGREPGWLHRFDAAAQDTPHPIDAKAQED